MNIVVLIVLPFLLTFAWASKQGAPWVPSRSRDMGRFIALAGIRPGETMYDIGCGDARAVAAAAMAGVRSIGYEISLLPFLIGTVRCLLSPARRRCSLRYKNFWSANVSDADVVYFFLMPAVAARLKEKFERELRPGARVIAYVWPVPGWTPTRVSRETGRPDMYLYTIA
jgi:SAM-dependent methyltransferase